MASSTPRTGEKSVDLATAFQAVSGNLVQNKDTLNQLDEYNHNHGDNMVEIFNAINEAVSAKQGQTPSEQLAYASELVGQRSQSGSAKMYASGLAQASQQFKGKKVTPDNLTNLLGSLLGGQASEGSSAAHGSDLIGSLLGGLLSGQAGGSPSTAAGSDLLGSLLGGNATGQASSSQSANAADLLGSLLGNAAGGQTGSSQSGLDMGDLLNAGKAFMNSHQQGEGTVNALIKAFVAATQAGQSRHRAESGELVANTIVQLLGKQQARR